MAARDVAARGDAGSGGGSSLSRLTGAGGGIMWRQLCPQFAHRTVRPDGRDTAWSATW